MSVVVMSAAEFNNFKNITHQFDVRISNGQIYVTAPTKILQELNYID